jgi:hypothetical protein
MYVDFERLICTVFISITLMGLPLNTRSSGAEASCVFALHQVICGLGPPGSDIQKHQATSEALRLTDFRCDDALRVAISDGSRW